MQTPPLKLRYWQDHAGPEVDYVLEYNKQYLPIEVKWTKTPTMADAKHLLKFMQEYPCIKPAYIICRCAKPLLLQMIFWHCLGKNWQMLLKIRRSRESYAGALKICSSYPYSGVTKLFFSKA